MLVTADPGIEESRVRRREFPRVYPKPGSSGSMTNRERNSEMGSSVRVGRCAMSTEVVSFRLSVRHMTLALGCDGWLVRQL
jgi:hypothetical protein